MARAAHTAWTPPSLPDSIVLLGGLTAHGATYLTAEIVPGKKQTQASIYLFPGGETFRLKHGGWSACGIPDTDSIVMTGGGGGGNGSYHNYVTRC